MIIDWSIDEVKAHVDKIAWAESDPRMDGFVTWRCKKDLYELLWYLEDKLERCSTYSAEEENLIKNRREHKIINKLESSINNENPGYRRR
jgi:hypothetical protein